MILREYRSEAREKTSTGMEYPDQEIRTLIDFLAIESYQYTKTTDGVEYVEIYTRSGEVTIRGSKSLVFLQDFRDWATTHGYLLV